MNLNELAQRVETLAARVEALETQLEAINKPRDRGPKSQGEMTDAHAYRVKFGDMKDTKHKAAAEALGLSYGQIFSCRGGYTFKHVKDDGTWNADGTKKAAQQPAEETAQQ